MRTRTESVALTLPARDVGLSAGRWLCSALRAAILDGRLRPGARLPSTRDLATRYRLSRGTIVTAFEQMKSEGYVTARSGSGTYVSTSLSDAMIFEDDYDSEFRYAGPPVPAMQALDRHGLVLFAGSFSKVLFPSIRLGYLVLPAELVERVAAMKSVANRFAPVLEQAVLSDFMTDGHFGRHVRRMRQVYAERLAVLLEGTPQSLAGLLNISEVEAGLQTTGWLGENINGAAAAAAAARRRVEVTPLSRYSRTPLTREGLVLGFAAVDVREIRRGVRELSIALEQCRHAP